MKLAIWIIACTQVARVIQNAIQLKMITSDKGARENAYAEFIKSLKQTDEEFAERMMEEWFNQTERGE